MKWIKNNPILVLLVSGAAIFLFHLGVMPVTIMEARNFITAREMVLDGNWLLTTMNELPRYEKPPLPTWFTAIFGWLFGLDNVAVLRFPAMLMAILLGFSTYKLALKLMDNTLYALLSALVLLTSFYIIGITIEAPWDIYTHGFMMVGIYFLFQLFSQPSYAWKNAALAGVFIGLSIMSKGPISFYALLLPFLLAYGRVNGFKGFGRDKKMYPVLITTLIALVLGLWWFIYVRLADPEAFLAITKKETANWSSYNVRPFYYYWSFFVQSGLWTIPALVSLCYPYLIKRAENKKVYQLTFFWTIFSVLLLSIVPEKKSRYLVPVLIPLALNIGIYLSYLFRNKNKDLGSKERLPLYLHFGIVGLIGLAFPVVAYIALGNNLAGLWGYYIASSLALVAIGLFVLIYLKKQQWFSCFLLSIGLIATIKLLAMPLAAAMEKNTDYHSISQLKNRMLEKGMPIYSFGEISPEMIWDYGSSLPDLKMTTEQPIPKEKVFGVVVAQVNESEFKRIFGAGYTVTHQEMYDLNTNASPGSRNHKNRLVNNFYIVKKQ
ncbi:MAG: glycosyltransferase family 39 protein [Arenibacter sp.]|nr:glycosyltransferase family 39 protein [Arenibacter sp.]